MVNRLSAAIIQARMGSTRLPGKVMLPLGGRYEVEHVIDRVRSATEIDEVVVATSTKPADDIVEWCADRAGTTVFRGDEQNVLDRMYRAAMAVGADEVVRITADCPLVHPDVVDAILRRRRDTGADYGSNILERTFPRGLDAEAFTMESFERVHGSASEPAQLEHATKYYHDRSDGFDLINVSSREVFEEPELQGRTDLRLTLDELPDYLLLREVFDGLEYDGSPSFSDAVRYIDENGLSEINASVVQKGAHDG